MTNNRIRTISRLAATYLRLNSVLGYWLSQDHLNVLQPVRRWLDEMEINDPKWARFLSKTIPAQCPFERKIKIFGRQVAHIPPLCKLNPLYEQLVSLRFRALCYLVDHCGEDIQSYV
ncbi:Mo-dependent nitrogenase C-terminal domain-containing protein [Lyngbya aestuarii]|uniref:Mo-dependent nitrogenase C-terminal domain-containing protein n=1 Tax=Lyngbya aestuarii TaxID=118322 RepID=UPI00403DFC02